MVRGSANAEMAATIASWAALTSGWAARNSEVNQRSTTALAIAALPPARTVAARSVQAEAGRPLGAGAEQGEPLDPLGVAGPDPRRRHGAERQPDEVGPARCRAGRAGRRVVGVVVDAVGAGQDGEAAVAAGVVANDPEALLKRADLGVSHLVCGPEGVGGDDDRAVLAAGDDGVDLHRAHRTASKTAARPWPPPMHIVSRT